ncbi:MAG: CarD family transcriptional regulator [Candidatus Cohnella colombiensis]|uniref:CarD family transcriptional regulator n=1 Tax=Candidatus Cohnella colombiensis TaxID=3121368 RepID=A0AA95EVW0_9BACL|nr:MAG: CarD family transcriptional regulator [Cohnella sp.]
MFNIGDLIIYSSHGICRIDDICDKTIMDVTRRYYILHPVQGSAIKISTPVDNKTVVMLDLIDREEAEEIIQSFTLPGIPWIDKSSQRNHTYTEIINRGNRKEIASIVNTLMIRQHDAEINKKKPHEQDRRLLLSTQTVLFSELAHALDTTYEAIQDRVNGVLALA